MTEWIISGNPKKYDVVNAFRKLKRINWVQSANMAPGDIVYIYVSGDIKAIQFRCRVNESELEEVSIDDSEYNISGEYDGSAGRYLELEMLEEFSGSEYSREELMKHGFSSPIGPVRMSLGVKEYIESVSTANVNNKRFSVNDSIWIAAASYAFMKYKTKTDVTLQDCFITAPQIQKSASEYTTQNVQAARIHHYCNGDHENPTHYYLRRIGKDEGSVNFRATARGEFKNDKELPSSLNWNEKIVVDGQSVVLEELQYFMTHQYKELVEAAKPVELSVQDAVWVVIACMTYDACKRKKAKFEKEDILFSVEDILKNVSEIIDVSVSEEQLDSVTHNLNDDSIHYLVSVSGKRRISYMNEFNCVKECPSMAVITNLPKIEIIGKSVDFKYVYAFVSKEYTERARKLFKKVEIENISEVIDLEGLGLTKKIIEYDKNMILYGPPGTGKTYNTAIYAVAICDGRSIEEVRKQDYAVTMDRYEQLKKSGRVAFTTFHQSYGYEEFIEGIKPVVDEDTSSLGYTIEPGVFKRFCEKAKIPEQKDVHFTGTVWNVRSRANDPDVKFDYDEYLFSEGVVVIEDIEDGKRQCKYLTNMAQGDLIVLGRNFSIYAIGIVSDDSPEKIDKAPFFWKRNVNWIYKGPAFTFTDIGMAGGCISNFAIAKSKIKVQNLAKYIQEEEETKPYVFIIDEINRGNISKIFGELITLIENTKRAGMNEAASAVLPYSGDSFSVPSNVYILGTMNTADRSIALMDTALRRRFQFIEMMPDSKVLNDVIIEGLGVAKMLDVINERIAFLYDREHTIGHAFFIGLLKPENRTVFSLGAVFEKSVIPLLQEYFYEDYQKIQLVLGDNAKKDTETKFIKDTKVVAKDIFVGSIEDIVDLPEKKFEINSKAFYNIDSYLGIAPDLVVL